MECNSVKWILVEQRVRIWLDETEAGKVPMAGLSELSNAFHTPLKS